MRVGGFREDIQGMRALAVLAIMLFHAGLSPYPGGFVTLDVFFVVSGFLITHLLVREAARDGRVSLIGFYARRARRILPAATVVAVATVAASAWLLNVVDARDAALDSVWAALFAANVRFASENTDYFAQQAAPSPLQHYWSLSVEEQFYLVLPVLVVGCLLVARRRRRPADHPADQPADRPAGDPAGHRVPTLALATVLAVLTAASLAWSVHASATSPQTAYFSTFTRTWEFGVGALLAVAAPHLVAGLGHRWRNLLAGLGLLAIVVACFVVTEETPFPGYAALLPVLGTGAVMLAGAEVAGRPPAVSRALGVAPLRVVGDLSYSLYLWHWPVLVLPAQHLGRELRLTETLALLALTFAVAWASYRLVETPLRRARFRPPSRALVLYPVCVAVVIGGCTAATGWVERRLGSDAPPISVADYPVGPAGEALSEDPTVALVQASAAAAREGAPIPGELRPPLSGLRQDRARLGACEYDAPPYRLCRRGQVDAERTLVLLGDSHGRHWIPAMEEIAERAGYAAYYLVKPACTPADVVTVEQGTSRAWDQCSQFNAWMRRQVQELRPDLLVVAGSGPRAVVLEGVATSEADAVVPAVAAGFERTVRALRPHAARTVVLGDTPRRDTEPAQCLGTRGATLADCLSAPRDRARAIAEGMRAAAATTRVEFVDTYPWLCAADLCPLVVGDVLTVRDHHHLTTVYARLLAEPLGRALGLLPGAGAAPDSDRTLRR